MYPNVFGSLLVEWSIVSSYGKYLSPIHKVLFERGLFLWVGGGVVNRSRL
jgi:hypothetical protein